MEREENSTNVKCLCCKDKLVEVSLRGDKNDQFCEMRAITVTKSNKYYYLDWYRNDV